MSRLNLNWNIFQIYIIVSILIWVTYNVWKKIKNILMNHTPYLTY